MTNNHKGGKQAIMKTRGGKHTSGGVSKESRGKNPKQLQNRRKAKAAAPTADELDNELSKYMGVEVVAKKLDDELDSYFKSNAEAETK